jgi:polysaccharide export outer membrane protein
MGTTLIPSLILLIALSLAPQGKPSQPPAQPPSQTPPAVQVPMKPDFVITRPQGAPPQTPAQPATPVPPERYVIGPADTLSITVVGEPDLTNKYRVDADGTITLPYVGRQAAAGSTVIDLQTKLIALLKDGYLQNPQVLIDVDVYKARSVLVVGEVRSPGKVQLTGLTMSLLEALALAGSPTGAAANEVIVVHTPKPGEPAKEITVNRRDLELGRAGLDVTLQDGDLINVPTAKRFWVSGQVRNPGNYVLDPGMTVAQALILAGGLTERGSDRRLTFVRTLNGKIVEVAAKMDDKVQPNDEIKVGSRLF